MMRTLVLTLTLVTLAPRVQASEKTPVELASRLLVDFVKYGVSRNPNPTDETLDARSERYALIAESIVQACQNNPWPGWSLAGCVALSATAAKWESGLLRSVHEGSLKGPAGELCLFQLHRFVTGIPREPWRISREEWLATPGLDAVHTYNCTDAGVRALGWQIARCQIRPEGGSWYPGSRIFQMYHLPNGGCVSMISEMSGTRGRSYQSLLWKLRG